MKKKKLKIIIPIVVVVLLAAVILYLKLSDKKIAVETAKVTTQNIEQHYDTTGTLTSGTTEKYYIYEGIVPKEVRVNPGDTVCKGDILATFDTSSMNSIISEKKQALGTAQKAYNDAVSSKNDTSKRAEEIDNQISALKDQISKLDSQEKAQATGGTLEDIPTTLPDRETVSEAINQGMNSIQNSKSALEAQIKILESEKSMVNTSQYDTLITLYKNNLDSAKEEYNNALETKKELDGGFVAKTDGKVGDVNIKAGEPYVYVADSSSTSGLASILSGVDTENMSSEMTGVITNLLGSREQETKSGVAITVDCYDGYNVEFSLGKYDAQTIRTGMKAQVTYTDYTYDAEVTYISPRAGSEGMDISSVMGGSSSGSSSTSLMAKATIKNPDEKLIIGFDAKLTITTDEKKNVLAIPVESLVIDEGKKYVFVYDEKTKTAVKREVEVGISSDQYYEVINGLSKGEIVILDTSKITDGAKVTVS